MNNATLLPKGAQDTNRKLEQALLYARLGLPVLPIYEIRNGKCSCSKGRSCTKGPGKHPRWEKGTLEHGVDDATISEAEIRRWAAKWPNTNWAIRCGGYLPVYDAYFGVLDIDPRHDGDIRLKEFEATNEPLPRRHLVKTGGGGLHFPLLSPVPVRKGKLCEGIDIQGEGCYIIAAGSNHLSGNSYELVEGPSEEPFEWMPEWVLSRLPKPKRDPAQSSPVVIADEFVMPRWEKTADGSWQKTDAKSGEVTGVLTDMTQRLADPKLEAMLERRRQKWAEKRAKKQAKQAKQQAKKQANQQDSQQSQQVGQQGQATGEKVSSLLPAICNICDCDPSDEAVNRVWYCLNRCHVSDSGMTNDAVYHLACGLRNIPELANKTAEELRPLVSFWFKYGKSNMSRAHWESVWRRWLYTWTDWSKSQVGPAWDAARELRTPAFVAEAEQSEHDGMFILRAICNHIQAHAYDGRWFLPVLTAKDVLAWFGIIVSKMTVSRWIKALVAEGYLVLLSYRDPACPATYWYQTAASMTPREENNSQRPTNRLTNSDRIQRCTLPEWLTAGGDEPKLTLEQLLEQETILPHRRHEVLMN